MTLIAESPDGLPLNAVARAVGLKPPTAHKLLRTLIDRRFIEKAGDPLRYRLGAALVQVADAHWDNAFLQRAAHSMRETARRVPAATVSLARAMGGEVSMMLRISPERPGFLERPPNRLMLPYSTATALVFQAFWTHEEREAYRRRYPFEEYGTHLWKSSCEVDAFLEEARSKGYAAVFLRDRSTLAVAAPIFSVVGGFQASLGASVRAKSRNENNHRALIGAVTQAARSLSAHGPGKE
jgi:DNA-binding IclR family transcriptional regulator